MNKTKKSRFNILWVLLILAIVFVFMYVASAGNPGVTLSINQVEDMLYKGYTNVGESSKKVEGDIVEIYVVNGMGYIRVDDSKISGVNFPKYSDYHFTYNNTTTDLDFILEYDDARAIAKAAEDATKAQEALNASDELNRYFTAEDASYLKASSHSFTYRKVNPSASFIEMILPYISVFAMILLGYLLFRMFLSKSAGATSFSKSRAKLVEKSTVKFSDVAGAEEEKEETRELVEFLKDPEKFKALGARIPKGILLVGQPGTGKTLLAKAVAGESNVPFFSISGSDFVELYVGVGASRVRDLFETAKRNAPCIVFIDEIDAVGRQRGAGLGGGNDEREQTLNQLLVEMDGFESNQGIIILAATNRVDVLDPALLRPGRFDRQIYVNVPDVKGREGIMKIYAKNKPIEESVDFKQLARLTSGFTGADIENFLNEAAILAARESRMVITMEDITEGINKVMMGPQKKSRLVTEKDKLITAYHESGHAIIAKLLDCGESVHEVSIIPRGMAAGYTSTRPSDDDEHFTISKLNNRICMVMGGRIAEEIQFGDITAGASSDIQKATEIARKMVVEWGMSEKIGFLSFGENSEVFVGRDYRQVKNKYSESTATIIDSEIKRIIDTNYKKAYDILANNKSILDNMANLLLKEETIYSEEVNDIINGVDSETIVARLNAREQERKDKNERLKLEQEIVRQEQIQKVKERAAEALVAEGVISKEEYERIKEEGRKIEAKKEALKSSEETSVEAKEEVDLKKAPKKTTRKPKTTKEKADKETKTKKTTKTTKKASKAKKPAKKDAESSDIDTLE